ncbi:MAG: hypothetical protein AAGA68_07120 [Pseudomonadota bacterium]
MTKPPRTHPSQMSNLLSAAVALAVGAAQAQDPFPAELEVTELLPENGGDGSRGVVFVSDNEGARLGWSVGGGADVNGDGVDDIILGAPWYYTEERFGGQAYLILGSTTGFDPVFPIERLRARNGADGSEGTVLETRFGNQTLGESVDLADFNGDGFGDLIVSAPGSDVVPFEREGRTFIVYGGPNLPAEIFVLDLLADAGADGSLALVLNGIGNFDRTGEDVAQLGDVNGDGMDDLGIQARGVFVVFGGPRTGPEFDLVELRVGDGSAGYEIQPPEGARLSNVSSGGDINGDGLNEILTGSGTIDIDGVADRGYGFSVFGAPTGALPAELPVSDLLERNGGDGSLGFAVPGFDQSDFTGGAVGHADLNADGYDDVAIGSFFADFQSPGSAGAVYLIYGGAGPYPAEIDPSQLFADNGGDGSTGTVFKGFESRGEVGYSVSSAGDLNGDNIEDLIIGATGADSDSERDVGEAYVIFGRRDGFAAEFELSSLFAINGGDGGDGFVIRGIGQDGLLGYDVSAVGDVNGDGIDDVVVGAMDRDTSVGESAGEGYLIFGRRTKVLRSTIDGTDGRSGLCVNSDTAESVTALFPGASPSETLDCLPLGLVVGAGDGIRLQLGGSFVDGLSGQTSGLEVPAQVSCTNRDTGEQLEMSTDLDGHWDCSLAGLTAAAGDSVSVRIQGTAPGGEPAESGNTLTLAGMDTRIGVCRNVSSDTLASGTLPEPGVRETVDCDILGLEVAPGDTLLIQGRGVYLGAALIGEFTGLDAPLFARCSNDSTGQTVTIPLPARDGSFDCLAAGLTPMAGDQLTVLVRGAVATNR